MDLGPFLGLLTVWTILVCRDIYFKRSNYQLGLLFIGERVEIWRKFGFWVDFGSKIVPWGKIHR